MGPKSSDWCPYKEKRGHTDTHGEKGHGKPEGPAMELCCHDQEARVAGTHQKLGENMGLFLPWSLQKEPALLHLDFNFQTPELRDSKFLLF